MELSIKDMELKIKCKIVDNTDFIYVDIQGEKYILGKLKNKEFKTLTSIDTNKINKLNYKIFDNIIKINNSDEEDDKDSEWKNMFNERFIQYDDSNGSENIEQNYKKLFEFEYPYNDLIPDLSYHNNYKRLKLTEVIIELNKDLFDNNILKYIIKRKPNKALVIPIWGYKWFKNKYKKDKVIKNKIIGDFPKSLLKAFEEVGVKTIKTTNIDIDIEKWATQLYKNGYLCIPPRKGDIILIMELPNDNMYFDGEKIISGYYIDIFNYPPNIGLSWPNIPLNYWINRTIPIPSSTLNQFKSNFTFGIPPVNRIGNSISYKKLDIKDGSNNNNNNNKYSDERNYSWADIEDSNGNIKRIYLFFDIEKDNTPKDKQYLDKAVDYAIFDHAIFDKKYAMSGKKYDCVLMQTTSSLYCPKYDCDYVVTSYDHFY